MHYIVFLKLGLFLFMCVLTACMCTTCIPGACECQKRVSDPLGLELQPLCGPWELTLGPLEEQPVLLTVEPSLQLPNIFFKIPRFVFQIFKIILTFKYTHWYSY